MRVVSVLSVVALLGACGDPLAGIGKLSEADIVATDPAAAALPTANEVAREGFFGTAAATGEIPTSETVSNEIITGETSSSETAIGETSIVDVLAPDVPATDIAAPQEPSGFLRKLASRVAAANPEAVAAAQAKSEPVIIETRPTISASVEYAALPAEPEPVLESKEPKRRGFGLFGGGGAAVKKDAPRTGPDAADVPFGTALAFGQIARVCDAKGKPLGKQVAGTGRRGFSLYDSNAGIRDKRTFYITGFSDDCPRQFTAANALLGEPAFYEEIRFGPTGQFMTYAATDQAYDGLKSKVCRTAKNKPCGKNIDKLDSSTVFVSAYEFGEINRGWKEFLIHDGEVLASALK